MIRLLYIFILSGFFFSTNLYSQKYEKDIRYDEKRISDFRKEGSFPSEMKMIYKCKESDYIVFYDLDGHEAYFKYKRNRFDSLSEIKLSGLHTGQTYRVRGRFIGLFVNYDPVSKQNFFPAEFKFKEEVKQEWIENRHNLPVFVLESYETTAFDEVIY